MQPATTRLLVDSLPSPSNIGATPVFSWRMESDRPGAAQTAYRIVVEERFPEGFSRPHRAISCENGVCTFGPADAPLWDSGVVLSSDQSVAYGGAPLSPARRYGWRVEVRDEAGAWLKAAESVFRTGFFDPACWEGSLWISAPDSPVRDEAEDLWTGKKEAEPGTAAFSKTVRNPKAVVEAWWCLSGLGVFEAWIGGRRVGDDFLKPGFTHFAKTKHSFCYDVTDLVAREDGAENPLYAEVSSGWWRDRTVRYRGKRSALRAVLVLRHADGSETRVATDETWAASGTAGPVRMASIYEGEDYDARVPRFAPLAGRAVRNDEFQGEIVPMEGPTAILREDLVLAPVAAHLWSEIEGADETRHGSVVKKPVPVAGGAASRGGAFATIQPGETLVVDFGQNCAAVPRFRFSAARGVALSAVPSEMLNDAGGDKERGCDGPEGAAYRVNYRGARTEARYTFAGEGAEAWTPAFTYFGGRYLSITATGPVRVESVEWVPVSSIAAAAESATFESGVPALDKLAKNILWSQRANYLSVPTDCPQRGERLGWTADTQVFARAAAYNADVRGFLRKWMRDMRDSRYPDGGFPGVAPTGLIGDQNHQFGWGDAGVIVPWTLWRHYGDTAVVDENWSAMVRYLEITEDHKFASPEARAHQWADWFGFEKLETGSGRAYVGGVRNVPPVKPDALRLWQFLGCCHWLDDARMMAEMAAATGRARDAAAYEAMARRARAFIRSKFVDPEDGMLVSLFRDMQTPALYALRLGVLDPAPAAATLDALLANVRDHGDKLQTGFLGTAIILDTMVGAGAADVAYTLLLQTGIPSWLHAVNEGATTVWEHWNGYSRAGGFYPKGPKAASSFNHYAYGSVFAWLMRTAAGIQEDPAAPGFGHVVLAPLPDRRLGRVSASYDSPRGRIESAWRYEDDEWTWRFTVPPNATATAVMPTGERRDFAAGTHVLSAKLP